MTTIKLKNGSGAPTAGDLVQGEPALDLTNKRLYTENASGTVIEVGTNPTSITTGTITGSGDMAIDTNTLFVDASANSVGIGTTSPANLMHLEGTGVVIGATQLTLEGSYNGYGAGLEFVSRTSSGGTRATMAKITADGEAAWNTTASTQDAGLRFSTTEDGTLSEKVRILASGNVGIGTTAPTNAKLEVVASSGEVFRADASGGAYRIVANQTGVNMNGNVGIGTTSPAGALHIHGGANGEQYISSSNSAMRFVSTGGINYIQSGTATSSSSAADLVFTNVGGSGETMRIDSSGNVGIGTASPYKTLTVGDTDATAWITSGGSNVHLTMSPNGAAGSFIVRTGGTNGDPSTTTERMRIDSSGLVGIGNTSPSSYNTSFNDLVVDGGTNSGATIVSGTTGDGTIAFADGTTGNEAYRGYIQYTHAGDDLKFGTSGSERMRIDSSGKVGIGIISPAYSLVVSNGGASGIEFGPAYSGTSNLIQHYNRSGAAYVDAVNIAAQHRFNIGGSEAMRIDSSGNLLVGKTGSAFGTAGVEINQNGVAGKVFMTRSGGDPLSLNRLSTDGEIQGFYKDGTQVGSIGTSSSSLYIGKSSGSGLMFQGGNTIPVTGSSAADATYDLGASGVRFKDLYLSNAAYLDKVIGHDDTNTYISFIGSDVTQFVQGGAEAMRLNASGDLLLGVSSLTDSAYHLQTDTGGSTGAQINTVSMGRSGSGYPIIGYNCAPTSTVGTYNKHYVDYASWIQFISGRIDTYTTTTTASGTTTGTAGPYLSSGGTSWTSSSDRRLKDNIEGISYGLEAVKLLNPVSYVRNDRDTGATELGFIAQEVDEVVSEVVSVKDDGYYGIDYERLIPVLTKAIQDQQDIIENLKSRIEQLEGAN